LKRKTTDPDYNQKFYQRLKELRKLREKEQ